MDLGTIKTKLSQNSYGNTPDQVLAGFAADVSLVFENAMAYNQDGSDIYNSASELLAKFHSKLPEIPVNQRKHFSQLVGCQLSVTICCSCCPVLSAAACLTRLFSHFV